MNSIWNKNLQAFTQRFPGLADYYKEVTKSFSETSCNFWTINQAKNGSLTAAEGNLRLHSSYNPQREAEQGVNTILASQKETVIFMGFGLGYHISALAHKLVENRQTSSIKVVIIEPDYAHFFGSMAVIDWTEIFQIEKLVLAVNCPIDSIIPLIENASGNQVVLGQEGVSQAYIFSLQAFTNHAQNYFDTVKELIQRNKSKNEINAATYDKFGKLWAKNSIANLKELETKQTVLSYINSISSNKNLADMPFLLLAAGPSLAKILPYLPQLKNKVIMISVETALPSLLRIGVQPDFILLTDPQYWAYKHIAGLKAPDSILICPISVYPAVFRFECKEILLCSDLFPVSQFFEQELSSFGDLGAGGSVASSAWNLCRLMGAKQIFLAGLDLSFPTKQTHIKGSSSEQTIHTRTSRLASAEKASCSTLHSGNPEYGDNYIGTKVLTDQRMKMFAWWFESRIAACPETKTFTLCPEGLKIPGVHVSSINELLSITEKQNIDKKALLISNPPVAVKDYSSLFNEYKKAYNQLSSIINTAIEKCMINSPSLSAELELLEKEINNNPLKEILHLGKPSEKYLEANPTEPKILASFLKYKKDLQFYNL